MDQVTQLKQRWQALAKELLRRERLHVRQKLRESILVNDSTNECPNPSPGSATESCAQIQDKVDPLYRASRTEHKVPCNPATSSPVGPREPKTHVAKEHKEPDRDEDTWDSTLQKIDIGLENPRSHIGCIKERVDKLEAALRDVEKQMGIE
ncbi:hypothetical protein BU23DRAFT_570229 [Bimuria novae-zelandiae CBS 107.79]|uniref:Uncharacterized protein n=1 Tax=Bimuria novae-zelandiae CBS 107.79 TaxID=1447943 RepID=A0A6A5V0L5_9PLEO|nr:hypothetical protein BU23DRAFT_570229 [Bimuria novae-zelandiae CBS 107.79]